MKLSAEAKKALDGLGETLMAINALNEALLDSCSCGKNEAILISSEMKSAMISATLGQLQGYHANDRFPIEAGGALALAAAAICGMRDLANEGETARTGDLSISRKQQEVLGRTNAMAVVTDAHRSVLAIIQAPDAVGICNILRHYMFLSAEARMCALPGGDRMAMLAIAALTLASFSIAAICVAAKHGMIQGYMT